MQVLHLVWSCVWATIAAAVLADALHDRFVGAYGPALASSVVEVQGGEYAEKDGQTQSHAYAYADFAALSGSA